MPELPEVETVRRQLEKELVGKKIVDVEIRFGKKLHPSPTVFSKRIAGRTVKTVERRAKLIRVRLSGMMSVLVHLKMTGRMLLKPKKTEPTKHTHVIFRLNNGHEIHWEDWRQFGYMHALSDNEADAFIETQTYGPEPLEPSFTWKTMAMCLRAHPKKKIKPLLLEQSCIAGIGNIYAAEAVWFAKLHPMTRVEQITDTQMKILHKGLVAILKRAIPAGGASADSYVDVYGHAGTFVPKLNVYGREGKPCRRCGTILKKMVLAGRSTVYCPECQKI